MIVSMAKEFTQQQKMKMWDDPQMDGKAEIPWMVDTALIALRFFRLSFRLTTFDCQFNMLLIGMLINNMIHHY
jgi:hypothetical protein